MYEINPKGMKFIRIYRCSVDENELDSFKQQEMTTDNAARKFELVIVDTKKYSGFSATTGKQVEPILALIDEKINGADFDGFLLDAYSRFARSEVDEARLFAACREANLLVITDKEGIMMGQGMWAKRGAATDQSEGYARDVGRHLTRTIIDQIVSGFIPPTIGFTWGLDREYYDPNGNATFRLRRLADGRRAVLDTEAPYAVRFYLPAKKRLELREDGHKFQWVPGDPEITAILRDMLRRYHVEGASVVKLCGELNRKGIPSPRGKAWGKANFARLLCNPIYIGKSVGFMESSGRYCERDKAGPIVYPLSKRAGYTKQKKRRKNMAPRKKPAKDWIIAIQPKLVNFLDEETRKIAEKKWQQVFDNDGRKPTTRPSRPLRSLPPKSRYFLSGILRTVGNEIPMFGSNGPTRGDDVLRYYITKRHDTQPEEGRPIERVRADLVEDEVKDAMRHVLRDFNVTVPMIKKYMEDKKRELTGRTDDTVALRAERSELEDWYKNTYSVAGSRGKALIASEAVSVEKRLEEIDIQLAEAGAIRPDYLDCDPDAIIQSVRTQFERLPNLLDGKSFSAMRDVSAALISKLTYDPAIRQVHVELALPSWGLSRRHLIVPETLPDVTEDSCRATSFECTNSDFIVLSRISCDVDRSKQRTCLVCRRNPLPSAA